MEIKDQLYKYIKKGEYKGPTEAAIKFKCSSVAIWKALRALRMEGKITGQSQYRAN